MTSRGLFGRKNLDIQERTREVGRPGDDQVVVKVRACGVCGTDVNFVRDWAGDPMPLGHEIAAEVVAAGRNVTSVAPGDSVIVEDCTMCGICDACKSGRPDLCRSMHTIDGQPGMGEYLAWIYHGGGLQLSRELYGKQGVYNIPCGLIPPEASGWFRKEIKTVQDMKGLKMRFFGLGAKVMEKMGVSTQLLAPGDIFQALQLGTIDATEFSLPVMDQKFGFYQVAKFYYFPGWHQQATFLELYINRKKWDSLSDQQHAIIELACGDLIREIIAEGEATQFKAMRDMQDKNGVQIKRWSPEIMAALEKNWNEVIAEESAKNPSFKRVYDSYAKFRGDYAIWRDHGYLK